MNLSILILSFLFILFCTPFIGYGRSSGIYGLLNKLEESKFGKYSKYPNVTNFFYDVYLPDMATSEDGTFTLMTIAQRRWGKTILNFGIIDVLMKHGKMRKICCWDAPHLVDLILEEKPEWEGRVYATSELSKVDNWSIMYMDEGLTKFNAKRALTKLSRKFEEALTYISHKQIILIVSAQTDGMMKGLRDKCEIVIYGRLPRPFLDASHKSFIKAEFDTLLSLPKEKCYVLSSAFGFIPEHEEGDKLKKLRAIFGRRDGEKKRGIGMIIGDKRERCKWFTSKISRNMSGETLDTDLEKANRDMDYIEEVVEIILDEVDESFLKNGNHIKGHFLTHHPDKYRHLSDSNLWKQVIQMLEYTKNTREVVVKKKNVEQIETQKLEVLVMKDKVDFPTYCRDWVVHEKKDETLAEIVYLFLNELSQGDIANEVGLAGGTVNAKVVQWRHDHMGFLFEKWFAQMVGGELGGGNKSGVDVMGNDGTIYSLKAYYSSQTALTFYQSQSFAPSYNLAKQNKTTYKVVLYNPAWKEGGAIIVDVDPKDDERVVIVKPIKKTRDTYVIFPTIFKVKDDRDDTISDEEFEDMLEAIDHEENVEE